MTTLQELIVFGEKLDNNVNIKNKYATLLAVARSFLKKEKQQIVDAYEWGVVEEQRGCAYENGTKYFDDNYEQ